VVCTVTRAFAGTLSTALVNAKSASDRSLTFCSESATRKSKMAYIVLAVISSDISDDSDTNFIYILSANKCQRQIRKNDTKNTLIQTKHATKSQFVYKKHTSHVPKPDGIEVFDRFQKNESALAGANRSVKDRSRKSGSIQERSVKLKPHLFDLLWICCTISCTTNPQQIE